MMIQEKKLKSAFKKFCFAMDCRLHEKERLGYQGWDDKKFMRYILSEAKKDMRKLNLSLDNEEREYLAVDIANRMMMIFNMTN